MSFKAIAITGGIGSGKSAVSDIIRSLGYTVYDADEIYAKLLSREDFVRGIYKAVGVEPCVSGGKIVFDRKAISDAVFRDRKKLDKLNEFTHSEVYKFIERIRDAHLSCDPLFFEIPLLFESGRQKDFDHVLVVTRPIEDRLNAVMKRSGLSRDEVLLRVKNQIDYDNFDFKEHTVIVNDKDLSSLKEKTVSALEKIFNGKKN